MSIRNDKFWEVTQENELGKAIFTFIKNNDKTSCLLIEEQNKFAEQLLQFIESQKKVISDEVEREFHREDILDRINTEWFVWQESVSSIFPSEYLDKIRTQWREDLNDSEFYWDLYWAPLIEILKEKTWCQALYNYNKEEQLLYKNYLKDWFVNHNEGEPVSIDEFLSNEMKDKEVAKYYCEKLMRDSECLAIKIIERANRMKVALCNNDSIKVILAAKQRFNLDMQAFLNGDDFSFMHDYVQLHQHYNKDSESFDNRFVPRFARPKQS